MSCQCPFYDPMHVACKFKYMGGFVEGKKWRTPHISYNIFFELEYLHQATAFSSSILRCCLFSVLVATKRPLHASVILNIYPTHLKSLKFYKIRAILFIIEVIEPYLFALSRYQQKCVLHSLRWNTGQKGSKTQYVANQKALSMHAFGKIRRIMINETIRDVSSTNFLAPITST